MLSFSESQSLILQVKKTSLNHSASLNDCVRVVHIKYFDSCCSTGVKDRISPVGSMLKCSDHLSVRGLNKRTKPSTPCNIVPMSVPLLALQMGHEKARFSMIVSPPCFRLMICSTWKDKNECFSRSKQYSHLRFARCATKLRILTGI